MKERFALFKSGLCSYLKRKLKTGLKNLYHTFWFCFYKKKTELRFIALLALLKMNYYKITNSTSMLRLVIRSMKNGLKSPGF